MKKAQSTALLIFVLLVNSVLVLTQPTVAYGTSHQNTNATLGLRSPVVQSKVIMIPGTVAVDKEIESAIRVALASASDTLPIADYYAVTDIRNNDQWQFASVVGLSGVKADLQWNLLDNASWLGLVLLYRANDNNWIGAVEGTEEFSRLLADVSEDILSPKAKRDLDPTQRRLLPTSAYRFPWPTGTTMQYGVSGVHDNGWAMVPGWKAVDFLSDGDTGVGHAPNSLLAAAAGTINYKCTPGSGEDSTAIRIDDLMYTHLLDSGNLYFGKSFSQGEEMGQLKSGTFNEHCGWANQASNHFHVHWGFPDTGSFEAGGWILTFSDQLWRRGSETYGTYHWFQAAGNSCCCSALTTNKNGWASSSLVPFELPLPIIVPTATPLPVVSAESAMTSTPPLSYSTPDPSLLTTTLTSILDTAPPSPPTSLESDTHTLAVWSNASNVHLHWSPPQDAEGPLAGYTIAWDQSPDTEPASVDDLPGSATEATSPPLGTGQWYAHLRAIDDAGNASSTVHAGPFLIDVAAPDAVLPLSGIERKTGEGEYWQNTPVTPGFAWQPAADEGSGVAGYLVYWGDDPNGTASSFTAETTYLPAEAIQANTSAIRYLRVAPVDRVDNLGTWNTIAAWQYDDAPPTAVLLINGGGDATRSLNVTLNLSAQDTGSGVASMRFSSNGVDWTEWEPYALQRGWSLNNQPDKQAVYAQVRDQAGNTSNMTLAVVAATLDVSQPASASYQLARSVLAMSGGVMTSTNYKAQGTSGQTSGVAHLQGSSYQVYSGYWTPTVFVPAAPTSLSATAVSQTRIDLAWTDNSSSEDGFKIERSPNGSSGWTPIYTTTASAVSYSNTGLVCSTMYYYRVRAYNPGGSSGYSNTANATTVVCTPTGLLVSNSSPTTLGQATVLTATATGSNISYAWALGDGTTASGSTASHIYNAAGVYTPIVTATNGGGSVTATMRVTVTNLAPIANAGVDQSVPVNATVTLDGRSSADPDGHTPLVYGWQQAGGPIVSLSNNAISQPTFSAPGTPTVLTFTLTVTDARGLPNSIPDQVIITVGDVPISGLAVSNSSPTTLGQATVLTATATGSNISYAWDLGDGTTASGSTVNHIYNAAGVYTPVVTATNGGGSVTATTRVTVTNLVPVANAGADQSVSVGTMVTLDGRGSFDPDGHTPLVYGWQQAGGPIVSLSNNTISQPTFSAPGTPTVLTFTLTVTDAYGLADSTPDQVIITVGDVPISGLAVSNSSPTTLGQATVLTATATGSNISYAWNLRDGAMASGSTSSHIYNAVGFYTAMVTATNSVGSVTATTRVTVTNLAPIANAGVDQSVPVNATVTLDGRSSADPDGHTPLTYRWQQAGGLIVSLSNNAISQPSFSAPGTPTVLTFTLTVTDARGLPNSIPDQVIITVGDVPISGLAVSNSSPTTLGQATVLTATATGSNISYAWALGDGTTASGSTASHIYNAAGVYTPIVTATNGGGSVTTTMRVTVTNLAPIANAGVDQSVPVNATVTLDGRGSADPDGHTPLVYGWQQAGGPIVSLSNNAINQPTFSAPGTPTVLTFTLTVTDARGLPNSILDQVIITVGDVPISGLAVSNSSPTTLGQATVLTATATGSNISYAWALGDGTTASGSTASTSGHK